MNPKNHTTVFFLVFISAVLACSQSGTSDTSIAYFPDAPARNAIIVVIDGTRFAEALGSMVDTDPLNDTFPKLWSLRAQGALIDTFFVGNPSRRTETNPGHAIVATGTYQNIANDGSEYPTMPTMFEYFRKQTGAAPSSCFIIAGKPKLNVIRGGTDPEYGSAFYATASVWDAYVNNQTVWSRAKTILAESHPNLAIINLPWTDVIAHGYFSGDNDPRDDLSADPLISSIKNPSGNVYLAYQDELRNADAIIYELWTMIQNDEIYKDTTVLIVTTDHGRHSDDCRDGQGAWSLKHHNGLGCLLANDSAGIGTCEGVQHLMFFAIGAGIRENVVSTKVRTLEDIAPTIGRLMGFSTAKSTGSVMSEILKLEVFRPGTDRALSGAD